MVPLKIILKKLHSSLYDFLKEFFNATLSNRLVVYENMYNFQMYAVYAKDPNDGREENNEYLMLLHGTDEKSATGTLQEGIKNSESGGFGSGVYLPDCSTAALSHAENERKFQNRGFYVCQRSASLANTANVRARQEVRIARSRH